MSTMERVDASPRWMRVLIAAGVLLAVLLLGASAGLVIPGAGRGPALPGSDSGTSASART